MTEETNAALRKARNATTNLEGRHEISSVGREDIHDLMVIIDAIFAVLDEMTT